MSTMTFMWAFGRLGRPHFLLGGALLFAVGAATADSIDARRYVIAQLMVTSAQITAHFVNEYADVSADRLNNNRTLFSGGSGVLTNGLLDPSVALRAAVATTILALVAGGAVATFSVPAAIAGLIAVGVSWAYSMPPARLVGSGFGEVVATVVVAGAVPLVGSLAQGGAQPAALWWAVAVLLPVHFAMIVSFELPDIASDAAAAKRVLAVRLGRRSTIRLMVIATGVASGVALIGWVVGGLPAATAWSSVALLPATVMIVAATRNMYAILTSAAVTTLVAVASGLFVGLVH